MRQEHLEAQVHHLLQRWHTNDANFVQLQEGLVGNVDLVMKGGHRWYAILAGT